jgi:hypothetical protein
LAYSNFGRTSAVIVHKALPYLGFVPDDLTSAPSRLVAYLALQLSVPSEALTEYGEREHTRTDPILGEIAKLTYLRRLGADTCELAALTPNRRKLLARIGRRATNQALQRTPPERRYPILLAFLEQAVEEVICSIAP